MATTTKPCQRIAILSHPLLLRKFYFWNAVLIKIGLCEREKHFGAKREYLCTKNSYAARRFGLALFD